MKRIIGERVGAVRNMDDKTVYLFGFGTYEGESIPPSDPKGERGLVHMLHLANIPNPKIKLDNGMIIWGCECWWGSEYIIKNRIEGKDIVMVEPEYDL